MKPLANLLILILIVSLNSCSTQKVNTYMLSLNNDDFKVVLNNREITQQTKSKIKQERENIMILNFQNRQYCCDKIEVILAKGPHLKVVKEYEVEPLKKSFSFDATPFLRNIEPGDRLVFTSANDEPIHFEIGIN